MTPSNSLKKFIHLRDTPIYARTVKSPGYRKYTIIDIRNLPVGNQNSMVTLIMKKNGCKKETYYSQIFACEFNCDKKQYELHSTKPSWSTSLTDFFLMMEAKKILGLDNVKAQRQYKYELSCNKNKYPEYWL